MYGNYGNKQYGMYEAPKVEVIEVEVEKGFAVSGGTEDYNPQPW